MHELVFLLFTACTEQVNSDLGTCYGSAKVYSSRMPKTETATDKNPHLAVTPAMGTSSSVLAEWAEQWQKPLSEEVDVLADMRGELQELGRGSLQRRAEQLTQLLLSLEEELAYIDRPYTARVDVCRGLLQDARRAGVLKARAR